MLKRWVNIGLLVLLGSLFNSASDTSALWYWRDGDIFSKRLPTSATNFQTALNYGDGSSQRKLNILLGPGDITHSAGFWIHGNTSISGAGKKITRIVRNPGSVTALDPAFSGNTFTSSFHGTTSFTTAIGDSGIFMTGLTIDGNCQTYAAVDAGSVNNMGMRFRYIDGVTIRDVEVKNFLQSGIQLTACKDVTVSDTDFRVLGQNTVASSRNGLDFISNAQDSIYFAQGYGKGATVTNCSADSITDTAFHLGNNSDVTFSNIRISGATKYGFEFETYSFYPRAVRNVTVTGVTAKDVQHEFLRFGQSSGQGTMFENINVSHATVTFNHQSGSPRAVRLIRSSDGQMKDISFSHCIFDSINGSDTNNFSFFEVGSTHPNPSEGITVEHCTFNGANPTSTNTGIHGIRIAGSIKGLKLTNNTLRDVPGVGIFVTGDSNNDRIVDATIFGNTIVRTGNDGMQVVAAGGTGRTIRDVKILFNHIEDACRVTGSNGMRVGALVAADTVANVTLLGNTVREKLTTATSSGIRISQVSGVTDSINVGWNDVHSISATTPYNIEGAPTNVTWADPRWSNTLARLGPYSTATTGGAIRIVDGVKFPLTGVGLQAANDDLPSTGGLVLFGGTIQTSVPLKQKAHSTWRGTGRQAAVIQAAPGFSGTAIVMPADTTGGQQWCALESMTIDGNSGGGAVVPRGVLYKGVGQPSHIRDVLVTGCSGVGIWREGTASNAASVQFENTSVTISGHHCWYTGGTSGMTSFIDVDAENPGTGAAGFMFDGVTSSIYPSTIVMNGVHIEALASGETGLWFDDTQGVSVNGLAYYGSGAVGTLVKITGSSGTSRSLRFENIFQDGNALANVIDDQVRGHSIGGASRQFIPVYTTDKGTTSRLHVVNAFVDSLTAPLVLGNMVVSDSLRANLGIRTAQDILLDPPANEVKFNNSAGVFFWNQSATGPTNLGARNVNNVVVLNSTGTREGVVNGKWQVADSLRVATTTIPGILPFASLGTPSNGTMTYCGDCTKATPCAGAGPGALAVRINGAWDCNP